MPDTGELVRRVPGVALHDDLGCWNILSRGREFTVVDWETARPSGFPLWDLWYFLADAAATADRVASAESRRMGALFRGEHRLSEALFRRTRTLVGAFGIDPEAVGALAASCRLHYERAYETAVARVREIGGDHPATFRWPTADEWLRDDRLGLGWDAWRAA